MCRIKECGIQTKIAIQIGLICAYSRIGTSPVRTVHIIIDESRRSTSVDRLAVYGGCAVSIKNDVVDEMHGIERVVEVQNGHARRVSRQCVVGHIHAGLILILEAVDVEGWDVEVWGLRIVNDDVVDDSF